MYSRRVTYREVAQQVRRFHRDRLLEAVSAASAYIRWADQFGKPRRGKDPIQQFTLAAIARIALARGTVHRADKPMTDRQLRHLCALAIELDHPDIPDSGALFAPVMRRLMTRLSYQQGFFQYDQYGDVMRTLALPVEHDPAVRGLPTAQAWEHVLGVPLPEYLAVVFALYVGANMRRGRFTTADLAHHAEVGAFRGHDAAAMEKLIATHLASDPATIQELAHGQDAAETGPGRQMWLTNPLLARPMISDGDGYLVPISPFLLHKITPLGMYFTGLDAFGDDFPRALGDSFEKVVGRHLDLLTACGAVVHPEITYGHENKQTVDYLVVFPELVLLVEAKSMRSTVAARLGDQQGLTVLTQRVQKARDQIDTTAGLLTDRIPELDIIPKDRPIRGLVVTLEPIPLVDTYLFADLLGAHTVPSATVCAHDFEAIVPTLATAPDAGHRLLDALTFRDPTRRHWPARWTTQTAMTIRSPPICGTGGRRFCPDPRNLPASPLRELHCAHPDHTTPAPADRLGGGRYWGPGPLHRRTAGSRPGGAAYRDHFLTGSPPLRPIGPLPATDRPVGVGYVCRTERSSRSSKN